MAYIGRDISNLSDRAVLDSITASATATYNLLLNSVAYVPSSAESLTVSLNGVIQKPQSSYTVSGSTIVFDSALTSSDSIDFIIAERAITLTTVGSGSVGTSQLVDGSVSNAKLANSSITLNGSAVSLGGSATIGGGKIGQFVFDNTTANFSTTSGSYSTAIDLSITPSSTSSKIFLTYFAKARAYGPSVSSFSAHVKLLRDATVIETNEYFTEYQPGGANPDILQYGGHIAFIDSPSTTSATTYTIQALLNNGNSFQLNNQNLVLMEVLA